MNILCIVYLPIFQLFNMSKTAFNPGWRIRERNQSGVYRIPLPPSYISLLNPAYADKLSRRIPGESDERYFWWTCDVYECNWRIYNSSIRAGNSNLEISCEICSGYIMPALLFASSKDYRISAPVDIWGNWNITASSPQKHPALAQDWHKISPFSSLHQYLIIGRD